MDENYDAERAISVANLAEQARQWILRVKDLSPGILKLNEEIQLFIEHMHIHPNVRIIDLADENRTILAYLPTDEMARLDQIEPADEEVILDVSGTEINTWEEFNEAFSDEFTLRGRELTNKMSEIIEQVESNIELIRNAKENLTEVVDFMLMKSETRDGAESFRNVISTLDSDLESSSQVLSDLKKVRDIFPAHETLTHEEEDVQENIHGPIEENRPFPDAWS